MADLSLDPAYRALILAPFQKAGTLEVASLAANLPSIWSLFADKGRLSPRLQVLHTQRASCDFLRAALYENHDIGEAGVTESFSQVVANLAKLRADIDTDIATLETQIRGGGLMAIGTLTQTQPVMPSPLRPDPNAEPYRGGPLSRSFRYRW